MADVIKATVTLDDATVEQRRRTSARVRKPQRTAVREAIAEYAARADKLSAGDRQRMLDVLDRAIRRPPSRSLAAVNLGLEEDPCRTSAVGRGRQAAKDR